MAREAGSGSLLLVAAASALGSSLLTLTALRLLSARQQAEQRALEADTAPACAPHSNGEALPQPAANPFDHSPRAGCVSASPRRRKLGRSRRRRRPVPPTGTRSPAPSSSPCSALSWDDYFMAVAFLSAQRSKDPVKQAGAATALLLPHARPCELPLLLPPDACRALPVGSAARVLLPRHRSPHHGKLMWQHACRSAPA